MSNFWNRISLIGVKTEYSRNLIRDIRLINVINLSFLVLFTIIGIIDLSLYFSGDRLFSLSTINTSIIVSLCLLNLFLLKKGAFLVAKLIIIIAYPFALFVLPLFSGHVLDEYFFWYPFIPSAFCVVPHLLFQYKKDRILLYLSILIYFIFILFVDKLLINVTNNTLAIIPIVEQNILFYRVSGIAMFAFINVSLFYFMFQSKQYENLVSMANIELHEQREELKTQNDELTSQRHKLSQKNGELEVLLAQLKTTQSQLIQSEKMASIGTLTSGVAHEINNPLNFISASLQKFEELFDELKNNAISENERILIINKCIKSLPGSMLGVERISRIVRSLLSFSEETSEENKSDLNKIVLSTLMIVGFKIPDYVKLEKHLDDQLPNFVARQDKIHQSLVALIDNAIYAIEDKKEKKDERIVIRTYLEEEKSICVSIANSGMPIPAQVKSKIFDPFFSTKPIGKGVGLGLTLSYNNITTLNGELIAEQNNDLVEFIIKLPLVSDKKD